MLFHAAATLRRMFEGSMNTWNSLTFSPLKPTACEKATSTGEIEDGVTNWKHLGGFTLMNVFCRMSAST